MEFFASGGRFWLPEHPHRVVHGELAFDDDGIGLQLMDPLRASAALAPGIAGGSPQVATEAVVHGLFHDGREVTMLHASGYSMPVEQMQETWSASFALTGGLIAEDRFSQVWVVLDYLMPWAQPPGIVHAEPAAATFTIDPHRSTLGENTLADGRVIRLITGVEGRRDEASVHFEQWCAFEVEGEPTSLIEILNEWVRPLQDLLVVCLGRPVRLDTILLRPADQDARMPLLRLSFNAVQPPGGRSPSAAHLESYAAPTLLTYSRSPLPFADLISEWFSLSARLPAPITLLCGPYYAPFIYSQHRYASTFQSAEALACAQDAGRREKTPSQHRRRVEAVTAVLETAQLDADTVRWAASVLQGRNDKPLRTLMEQLILSTGEMGAQLLTALPDLPNQAAAARANVSHPSATGPGTLERHWIGEALIWVIRAHLIARLGIKISDLSASVTAKPAFQEILQELSALAAQQSEHD